MAALKWLLVGRFRQGNYGFYSRYHFVWALMMTLLAPVYPLVDAIHGTVLATWFYRRMGATVGYRAVTDRRVGSNLATR